MNGLWLYNKPLDHTRLIMNFGKKSGIFDIVEFRLFFNDTNGIGNFYIMTPPEAAIKMTSSYRFDMFNMVKEQENINKEVLSLLPKSFFERPDEETFCAILMASSKKNNDVLISNWMLNQKNVTGIGNYIKSESLYLAKINPFRPIDSLTLNDMKMLYHSILNVMTESYNKGGLKTSHFMDPDFEKGSYETIIYDKKQMFDVNGREIISSKKKGEKDRNTFWVPGYQI